MHTRTLIYKLEGKGTPSEVQLYLTAPDYTERSYYCNFTARATSEAYKAEAVFYDYTSNLVFIKFEDAYKVLKGDEPLAYCFARSDLIGRIIDKDLYGDALALQLVIMKKELLKLE